MFKRERGFLYRDGAFSKVGLPYENIEEYSFTLVAFPLCLPDDVTETVLVLASHEVALTSITISHDMIICEERKRNQNTQVINCSCYINKLGQGT